MRWPPDARERLRLAAFELFAERGYSATTVPQITARAGLTTRTFFRYFSDKREVIFGGSEIPTAAASLIREAPAGLEPMAVVRHVLHVVATSRFDGRREETGAWRKLINANESLRDRDARKRADLVSAAKSAFIDRGETELDATMVAEVGALAFHVALDRWLADPAPRSLADAVDDVLGLLAVDRAANTGQIARVHRVPPERPQTAGKRDRLPR